MQPPKKKILFIAMPHNDGPVQTTTIVDAAVFSHYSADGKLYFSGS